MTSSIELKALLGHRSVLLLHNAPDPHAASSGREASDAAIMDQVTAVSDALRDMGLTCRRAAVSRMAELPAAIAAGPEPVVFNLVESLTPQPEDMVWVPAICQAMGRACTGGNSHTLFITQDKDLAKHVLGEAGVPVPRAVCVPKGRTTPAVGLPDFPVIVKPVAMDASEGIDAESVIARPGPALDAAVTRIHRLFHQAALIEAFVDGREFNIALVENSSGVHVLPPAEILFNDFPPGMPRIVDYAAKWNENSFAFHHTPRQIPAHVTEAEATLLRETARHAWTAAGCRDFARVDMRMDWQGHVAVLEVNVNPDLSPNAGFAAALDADGLAFHDFTASMLLNALRRSSAGSAEAPVIAPRKQPAETMVRHVENKDREPICMMLQRTCFFRPDELAIAKEVLDDALAKGPSGHYQSYAAFRANGDIAGWICFGPTPCTEHTWDIYWLAVDPRIQKQGVGRTLMRFAESRIREAGGRLCVVETSGKDSYATTLCFYERIGYRVVARIPDFYGPGDDKLVMTRLTSATESC